jgi:hypothetical protein
MIEALRYRVIDRQGKIVVEGTSSECAEAIHCSHSHFHRLANGDVGYPEYWVVQLKTEPVQKGRDSDTADLIKSWDDFVTPIREAYGVPRYVPKEVRR